MLQKNKDKQERKAKRKPVLRPCRFTKRRHTPERKEEIEMNDIRLKDATRILKKNGYTLNRVSGDHYTYKNESGRPLLLVFHMKRGNSCPYPIWNKMVKKHNIKY